jgi:hypothetical protein
MMIGTKFRTDRRLRISILLRTFLNDTQDGSWATGHDLATIVLARSSLAESRLGY